MHVQQDRLRTVVSGPALRGVLPVGVGAARKQNTDTALMFAGICICRQMSSFRGVRAFRVATGLQMDGKSHRAAALIHLLSRVGSPACSLARTSPAQDSRTFDGDMTDAGRRQLKDLEGQWKKVCVLGGSKGVGKEVIELLSGLHESVLRSALRRSFASGMVHGPLCSEMALTWNFGVQREMSRLLRWYGVRRARRSSRASRASRLF